MLGAVAKPKGGQGGKNLEDTIKQLSNLLFDPKLSIERFRDDFKTPKQVLSFIHALLSVILRTEPPEGGDNGGAYSILWERFHAYLSCPRAEGGNILDRLFDCLNAITPCPNSCECCRQQQQQQATLISNSMGNRTLNVNTTGLLGYDGKENHQADRSNAKIALCKTMELQVMILLIISGILRAIPKAMRRASGSLRIDGAHAELGMFPYVLAKLLHPTGHSGATKADSPSKCLLRRVTAMCVSMRNENMPADDPLIECLLAKVQDALKLVIMSAVEDRDYSSKAATWCSAELPPEVCLSVLTASMIIEVADTQSDGEDRGPQGDNVMMSLGGFAEGNKDLGRMAGHFTNKLLSDERTAENYFRVLEMIGNLADSSWLLSRTSCEASMPWATEWEETIHAEARKTMFETVGMMCQGVHQMKSAGSAQAQRFAGALIRRADESLRAVLSGWDEYLLMQSNLLHNSDVSSGGADPSTSIKQRVGGIHWLISLSRSVSEASGGNVPSYGRLHTAFLVGESIACPTEHRTREQMMQFSVAPARMAGYRNVLIQSARELCSIMPALNVDMNVSMMASQREDASRPTHILENLHAVRFSLKYDEQVADVCDLENETRGMFSSCLCILAVSGIKHMVAMQEQAPSDTRTAWQNVCAVAIDCIALYAWHAELAGMHQYAVQLISQAMSHLDSAAIALQLVPPTRGISAAGEGMCFLFACVLKLEETDVMCRMPITKAVLALMDKVFSSFEKHFGSTWSSDEVSMDMQNAPKVNANATNATVTLVKIEDACQDPTKLQRNEWKTMGFSNSGTCVSVMCAHSMCVCVCMYGSEMSGGKWGLVILVCCCLCMCVFDVCVCVCVFVCMVAAAK